MARYLGKATAIAGLLAALALATGCGPGPHVLYGFVDAQGNWVVPPEYDDAYPFSGGLAAVQKGDRWGFVDTQGRRVIGPAFAEAWPFTEGLAAVRTDAGWMFVDSAGETVIPGPFENALPFVDGLAAVESDGKWGFINRQGRLTIPARFDELRCRPGQTGKELELVPATWTCFFEGLAAARLGDRWGYIDRQGRWAIEPRFEHAMPFSEGLAAACEPRAEELCLFGYLDRRGEWAIAPRFLGAMHFSGGRAIALVERGDPPPAPDPAAVGEPPPPPQTAILIDATGREIADLDWEPLLENFAEASGVIEALAPDYLAEGLVPATEGNRWGYRDRDGQWRIEPQYAFVMPFRHGVAAVGLSDDPDGELLDPDRWELVDTQGRRIGTLRQSMLGGGAGPLFLAQLHSRWGLLDRDGHWRVPPVYAEEEGWLDLPILRAWAAEGLYRMGVHANHRWIVADTRGRRLASGEFQWVSETGGPEAGSPIRLSFLRNGLWGLANVQLKPVAPARFDRIEAGADALLEVTLEGRVGCMDRNGRWVVPAELDEIVICGRDGARGRRGAEVGTWVKESGWTPDANIDQPESEVSPYDIVSLSMSAHWRKQGDRYHLIRDDAPATDFEPADEVRRAQMSFPAPKESQQFAVVRRGTSWFVLDEAGRPWLPGSYDGIGKMYDGLVAVQQEGRWSIVDSRGRDVFAARDHELQPFTRDVAIFCLEERCGLVHRDGRVLMPPTYRWIAPFSRRHARIGVPDPESHDDQVGLIDPAGRVIVEPIYRNVEPFSKTVWHATDRHRRSVLLSAATGEPVPGLEHLVSASQLSEGLAKASFRLDADTLKAGYVDQDARIIIPPRFDEAAGGAAAFEKGAALVTIDGRCGAIDRRGKLIVPAEYDHCYRLSDGRILAGAEAGAPPLEPFLKTAPAGLEQ